MKKIIVISSYENIPFQNSFENLGYNIDVYPLFKYNYDIKHKKYDCKTHLHEYIKQINPDIILWWFVHVPNDIIEYNTFDSCYSILFSNSIETTKEKGKYCNLVYYLYKNKENNKSLYYGFNPSEFYPLYENYDFDISICGDELDNVKKELIDSLISEKIKICIYGSEFLKILYNKHYSTLDKNLIFNKSRINLSLTNEFETSILGSGGLLLTNNFNLSNEECIFIDESQTVNQIKNILNDYSSCNKIKEKGYLKSKCFTWDKWTEKIHEDICHHYFDENFYKKIFNIPQNIIDYKEYYEKIGKSNKEIPFSFSVPKYFDYIQYTSDYYIDKTKAKEYIYWHYKINSRNIKYIIQFDTQTFNIKKILNECKIDTEGWCEVNLLFKNISKEKDIIKNLKKLQHISEKYNSDINKLLELYFEVIEK